MARGGGWYASRYHALPSPPIRNSNLTIRTRTSELSRSRVCSLVRLLLLVKKIPDRGLGHHGFDGAVACRKVAFLRGAQFRLQVGAEVARPLDDALPDADALALVTAECVFDVVRRVERRRERE